MNRFYVFGFVAVAGFLVAVFSTYFQDNRQLRKIPDGGVRIASYNIRNSVDDRGTANDWSLRKEDVVGLVRYLEADVVGFQEVLPDQMVFLRGALSEYEFVGEYRDKDDPMRGEASPVAFRRDRFVALKSGTFWLSETPDVPKSIGWDAKYARVCSYAVLSNRQTGCTFAFANCHTDHKGERAREQGLLLVQERMKSFGGGIPIVFTGDHNCHPWEPPAKALRRTLADAREVAEIKDPGPDQTVQGFGRSKVPGDRIDYIYVSPEVRVIDFETVDARRLDGGYPSDHYPIVSTIVFPKAEGGVGISGRSP